MTASDNVKRIALDKLIDYIMKDPQGRTDTIMDMLEPLLPASLFPEQRKAFRSAFEQKNNWYQLIMKALDMNEEVMPDLIKTFLVEANFLAWPKQEEARNKHECNIPWAILLDPTSACNLHCTGCWAAEYGHKLNLSFDDIDSIIEQGKELGVHVYIYTGGEPLVRKKDLIALCEKHPDCAFLCFTNATLIDEEFCQDMIRVKNFVPAISAEGSKETTDARRGEGTYDKIAQAMALLKGHRLPYGISACYTSQNADAVASEEYFDWMIDQGALFCWIFTYMPVGTEAVVDLMPSVEQRRHLYDFVREMRQKKPLFTLDFQNDGEFVGGCIAGGRRYMHINAAGDVEPCVFVHYSNANIHETSLLEALKSPLFMAYYRNQPFNGNLLRPCPILENPDALETMVEATNAQSTDLQHQESAHDLCEKCRPFAQRWAIEAEAIWNNPEEALHAKRTSPTQGMAESDLKKFDKLQRPGRTRDNIIR